MCINNNSIYKILRMFRIGSISVISPFMRSRALFLAVVIILTKHYLIMVEIATEYKVSNKWKNT